MVSPHRERGLEVFRLIPINPEPVIPEKPEEENYDFLIWKAEEGGTYPEYLAYMWLVRRGYEPGLDFIFQSYQMGGRQMPGGAVVDFEFPALRMVWRIQGEYWHIGNPAVEARDEMQKLALMTEGYLVVDCYAQDVINRTDWVLSNAINGIQVRSLRDHPS